MSWRRFFHRKRADRDHAQEFESFLQFETDENIARGMTPGEARRAAYLKFGNTTLLREEVRRMNSIGFLETFVRDARYAVRALVAKPGFTIVSLLTLGLGIGATTAIFTVVNGVLLRPLPFHEPDRLVTIWETNPNYTAPGCGGCIHLSPASYLDMRGQNRVFSDVGAFTVGKYNLTGAGAPDRVTAGKASASLFQLLGVQPQLGRLFMASDDTPGAERVAVLSHSAWQERFGADPNVVGKTVRLDDSPYSIVGVMRSGFRLLGSEPDLWVPIERNIDPQRMHWRFSYYMQVIARLKPGLGIEQARQDAGRIIQDIKQKFPDNLGRDGAVMPLLGDTVARAHGPLLVLLGAVGFVLLIACANVANLNLGRAAARRRELAIRLSLGASPGRLIRQLFTESLVLALAGAALGVGFASWGVQTLLRHAPKEMPRAADIHVDGWALAFALLAGVASALIFGLLPALTASKHGRQEALGGSGRSTTAGVTTQRMRGVMAISEIAIALILLIGAGLMIESFRRLVAVDPGFNPGGLVTMHVPLSETRYDTVERQNVFFGQLFDRLQTLPGVRSFGAIDGLPFSDGGFDNAFAIAGRPPLPAGQYLIADIRRATRGYFSTMGIPIVQGRGFLDSDQTKAPTVAVISQSMARRYWPNESPIGKTLNIYYGPQGGTNPEIIGVAGDVRNAFDDKPTDSIYLHYLQGHYIGDIQVVLRPSAGNAVSVGNAVRGVVSSLDSNQPVYRVQSMEALLSASTMARSFQMFLLASFAALAACLAAIGLYGVLAYSVLARTREIGIRAALGSTRPQILATVLKDAVKLIAIGLGVGLGGAFALTRLLEKMLFEVRPTDPATFAGVSLLLLVVSLAAAYVPARRATRVDPIVALRYE